jgi:hypothetical protein
MKSWPRLQCKQHPGEILQASALKIKEVRCSVRVSVPHSQWHCLRVWFKLPISLCSWGC